MRNYEEYPKVRYTADGAVTVADRAEEDALEGEHFDLPDLTNLPDDLDPEGISTDTNVNRYVHVEYPKWVNGVIVGDEAEEATVLAEAGEAKEEPEEPEEPETAKPASKSKKKSTADDDLL